MILGLSFDCLSFPSLKFNPGPDPQRFSLGLYSSEGLQDVTLLKNVNITDKTEIVEMFGREDIASTLFICHLKPHVINEKLIDTQPFNYHYAGKEWLIALSGEIEESYKVQLTLFNSPFTPKGTTSAELILSWILEQLREKQITHFGKPEWKLIYSLLQSLNELGSFNVLLSNGQDLIAYQDKNNFEPLYWLRSCPPHQEETCFEFEQMSILLDVVDINHTLTFFSNVPLKDMGTTNMQQGQMLVVRSGGIVWDSHDKHSVSQFFDKETIVSSIIKDVHLLPVGNSESIPSSALYISTDSRDEHPNIFMVTHESIYEYEMPVHLSKHLFRLQPIHDLNQSVLNYQLTVQTDDKPSQFKTCNFSGTFGNNAMFCEISEPYSRLHITSKCIISVCRTLKPRFDIMHQYRTIPLLWMPWDRIMMQAYLVPVELPESELFELSEYAMSFVKRNNHDVIETLNDINQTIYRDYTYLSGSTTLSTTPYEIFTNRKGVCQDFANLFICLARLLNIPARYRVGYIYTGADYENKIQSEASHAWVEVYLPYIGWIGYDPTNCCFPSNNHVRVACGRNYRDATPTSGTIYKGGGHESLKTSVKVVLLDNLSVKDLNFLSGHTE